jgi:hypothetical protein
MRFFDASALVKKYVRETDSARVRRLLGTGGVALSRLSEVEVVSAFARLAVTGRTKCTTGGRFKVYHPEAGGECRRSVRAAARHATVRRPVPELCALAGLRPVARQRARSQAI